MTTPTPSDALRDVIEALDKAMEPGASPSLMERFDACASNFMAERADTIRRALETLAAVEAAPVATIAIDDDNWILESSLELETSPLDALDPIDELIGQRVALVRVGEG
jgi:hypothetical protein